MEYILKTNGITKNYGYNAVVNNVFMNIGKGDIYGFVGENGSGKTTLIRMITGLIKLNSGSYELFGVNNDSPDIYLKRRKVGAIVEAPSIHLNMNARDNLVLQCKLIGEQNYSKIDEVLSNVGLGYLINDSKKASNFSLGMKQRLGIAMALLSDPEFLILDEPMNGLDPEGIAGIRSLILRLNEEKNITFLISSHILSELSKVATRYGFIHRGKLIKELDAKELENIGGKKVDIIVDSNQNADNILPADIRYELIGANTIRFIGDIDINEIVVSLAKANIKVIDIRKHTEDIESYYFKVMGSGNNE